MTIDEFKIGWKKLKKILDNIRKVVNRNQPVKGDGILLNWTDSGCIISTEKKHDDGSQSDSTQTPMSAGQWTAVTVVDPATCAQSTLQVWALPP